MVNKSHYSILVTGGTGFVGLHLIKKLLQVDFRVHLITRINSNLKQFSEHELDRLNIHEFNGSYVCMDEIVKEVKPDVVIHLASLYITEHQSEDISALINSNIQLGTILVEAMAKNNCFKLINVGTSWQHYNNDSYNPVNLYAATKQAFEDILHYYTEAHSLKVITIKLFDTYGPGDNRRKLLTLLYDVAIGKKTLNMSKGEQYINLVYIDDVVDAFLCMIERINGQKELSSRESFVISSEEVIRLSDFVKLFEELVGLKVNVQFGAKEYRLREVMLPWNNGECVPGWSQKYNLIQGLNETLKSIQKENIK